MELHQPHPIDIPSGEHWVDTGITLEKGGTYDFEAVGYWTDWTITCDANGFSRWYLKPVGWTKRNLAEDWFVLMGSLDKGKSFRIGKENKGLVAESTGRLFCFANDFWLAYGNNEGSVKLTVTRTA